GARRRGGGRGARRGARERGRQPLAARLGRERPADRALGREWRARVPTRTHRPAGPLRGHDLPDTRRAVAAKVACSAQRLTGAETIMGMRGGIDLGGTKIQAVVVAPRGAVLGECRLPTPTTGGPPDVAAAMVEAVRSAAEAAGADTSELDGVGVGSSGAVDDSEGTVAKARNLPDWEEPYPLRDRLAEELGVDVRLGNDVQVATDAEFAIGAAKPYSSILGVFWGTGVGGGIVLRKKPWVGRSAAGEI